MMRQWVLASRPDGLARTSDFAMQESPIPTPDKGQVLLKTQYLGVAPVMLRYMNNGTFFERPLEIGDVMHGRGVGIVVASRNSSFKEGDIVQCKLGWREYALIDDDSYYMPFVMKQTDLPWSYGVSALAMSGFTALLGLRDICNLKKGERVLVSGAAGGVGSQVAFIAKSLGCEQVVGIAGGKKKCHLLTDRLAYDDSIDYKGKDFERQLNSAMPDGINVFFDNVGGEMLDTVMGHVLRRGRIAICGRISEYLKAPDECHRPRNFYLIGLNDLKLEGFFIYNFQERFRDYESTLAHWIRSGEFHPLEDIMHGLEKMPDALIGLYEGTNCGVRVVQIDPDAR